jgi:regulator of nonsense transcripts 2
MGALYRYYPGFAVRVIDNVIESICFGLEQNDYKYYQRRIAEVKYLGELYNYRMVEHPVIFDTMYRIVTFGHGGPPVPGRFNPFDVPDDFFRIRLVATILETCGMYFSKGAAGKKLDSFLAFFQYYIFTKQGLPMDIEFIVQDTFALTRPQWKLATSLEEAAKVFQNAIIQDQKTTGADKANEADLDADEEIGSDEEDDDDGDVDLPEGEIDGDESSNSDSDSDDEHSGRDTPFGSEEDEDEAIVVKRREQQIDPESEADFEREYAKMMAESLESRKFERKPLFDVALPVRAKNKETIPGVVEQGEQVPGPASQTMAFSLLTKKGNRQQVSDAGICSRELATDSGDRRARSRFPPTPTLL